MSWLYEFWQWWHITVTPLQTKDLMCCYLLWLGEVRQSACFFTILRFSALLFSALLSEYKRYLSMFEYWSPSLSVYFLLLLSFSTISSNIIFFKSLYSIVYLPSLLSLPSPPTPYLISFPLPCHFCTIVRMMDWWLPVQYLAVIIKSPRLVLTNLELIKSVHTLTVNYLTSGLSKSYK